MAEDPTPEAEPEAPADADTEPETGADVETETEAAPAAEDHAMDAAGQAAIDAMGLGEAAGPVSISELTNPTPRDMDGVSDANAVNEVEVELSVVLGQATMPIHQLLKMGRGAVIELDAHVDDDTAIYANKRMIAHGQVVVVGENIAVSITDTVRITDT